MRTYKIVPVEGGGRFAVVALNPDGTEEALPSEYGTLEDAQAAVSQYQQADQEA
jgi:hypothetical protein